MSTVIDILEQLESNNSRLFKEDLLETHRRDELLRKVFMTVGDVYLNFYINKFKMPKARPSGRADHLVVGQFIDKICKNLSTRSVTGLTAKVFVCDLFENMTRSQQKWCLRILLKNLRCGVQSTTVNKIWPGLIAEFSVQLAETLSTRYENNKGIVINDHIAYPVRVEPKLDGLRCILVKHAGEVTMYTRSGNVLETLPRIKSLIEMIPQGEFILDGEIMGTTWNDSASVVMSYKKNKDDSSMVFHVFDAMSFDDWRNQKNSLVLTERLKFASDIVENIANPAIVTIPGRLVNNEIELLAAYAEDTSAGYEGIMVKDINAPYVFKRSSNIRKLKPTVTYEGIIVGHYEGKRGSKREGLWCGFEVLLSNGVITRVAGGFTDKKKAEINMTPDAWTSKIVEIEGQPDSLTSDGLTVDGKIRFPVYIRERDPRDVDFKIIESRDTYMKNRDHYDKSCL